MHFERKPLRRSGHEVLQSGGWPVCLVAIFATLATLVEAQTAGTGALTVAVTDPTGAAIPGAALRISNAATGLTRSEVTGTNGSYTFTLLSPGSYSVNISASGFSCGHRLRYGERHRNPRAQSTAQRGVHVGNTNSLSFLIGPPPGTIFNIPALALPGVPGINNTNPPQAGVNCANTVANDGPGCITTNTFANANARADRRLPRLRNERRRERRRFGRVCLDTARHWGLQV